MGKKKAKLGPNELALLDAARDGRGDEVKRLLAFGVRVDPRDDRRLPRDVTGTMSAATPVNGVTEILPSSTVEPLGSAAGRTRMPNG